MGEGLWDEWGPPGLERSRESGGAGRAPPPALGLTGDPPAQLISQEPNPGVRFEYHLPLSAPRPGFSWSHGSWGDCSAECGGGEGSSPREGVGGEGGTWTSR